MGETKYHIRVKEFIGRFGLENPKKYIRVFFGSKNPIHITHPQARRKGVPPLQYEPDVYFVNKNKHNIIFEILDTELEKTSEIISDMIQCCLCSSTKFLIFVIPTDDEREEFKLSDTWDVIKDTLINLGVNGRMIPELAVYYILRRESKSYKTVKKILSEVSKTDGW